MEISITLTIIIATSVVSLLGFSNRTLLNNLIFYPPAISQNNQWYRFITCGLIHADWGHLLFNMYAFYIFGETVETAFAVVFKEYGKILYLLMYASALLFCLLPTFSKHKNDHNYRSLGASGAVSAVVFAFILLFPLQKMGLIFIPVMIPGFIFGFLYLIASTIFEKRAKDNVNHSAHIWGGLYGIAFLIVCGYFFTDDPILQKFITDITGYLTNF